jgi:hypothetical protein
VRLVLSMPSLFEHLHNVQRHSNYGWAHSMVCSSYDVNKNSVWSFLSTRTMTQFTIEFQSMLALQKSGLTQQTCPIDCIVMSILPNKHYAYIVYRVRFLSVFKVAIYGIRVAPSSNPWVNRLQAGNMGTLLKYSVCRDRWYQWTIDGVDKL